MLKFLGSGLRAKLVLLVVAGIICAFTLFGAARVHFERERIAAETQRSGQERVTMIAEAVANLIVGYDYSNMESLAERIVQQEDVSDIVIKNRNEKVMVSRNKPVAPGQPTLTFTAPVFFSAQQVGRVELRVTLGRMEAEIRKIYREVVLEQLISGLLLGLLMYFGASYVIVRPIRRIREHMKAILDSGDVTVEQSLEVDTTDELGDLARVFNSLNAKVMEAQQRLREKIDLAGSALVKTNEQLQQRTAELEQRTQDLEKALALVEKLAVTDSLTDLRNRRYFDDNLAAAFARAQRFGEPLCLVLLDVDHFKQINDTYGHSAGDTVLQQVSQVLKARARETDVVARLGGDEFGFLLYRTNREDGTAFAQHVLDLVQELRFQFDHSDIRIGLSVGVATNEGDVHSIEALYGAADEALYEAKRRGRNQVVAYPFELQSKVRLHPADNKGD